MKESNFESNSTRINQDPIFNIFTAIRCTHTLQIAHELKLFSLLQIKPLTLSEIATNLKIQERAVQALVSVCSSLELIVYDNEQYYLTEISKHYLLPESPYYYGFMLDMAIQTSEIASYEKFKESLLNNQAKVYDELDLFAANEKDLKKTEIFTRAMNSKSIKAASFWPKVIPLSSYHTLLDIGGGSGAHAISAVKTWPSLNAIIYERPLVAEIAKQYIDMANLKSHIKTQTGNIWQDNFPEADLHFYSNILHDWPKEKCELLLKKSYNHLPIKGRVIIHEMLFDDQKTGPLPTAIYNMIMLLWTEGQQFSRKEMLDILNKTGFKDVQILATGFGNWSIVTGVKLD